jgi:cytochrome c biogenesis protein CcmG, thiol:disulfide interchange protein DsbE
MSEPRPSARRGRVAPFVAMAVALVCAGLFVVLAGADTGQSETADTPLLNRPAPDAVGKEGDGTTFDLARRKGSWVVLNFFDPECVPCVEEHPELVEFDASERQLGADGAELATVVFRDDRDGVAEFFAEEGGEWPVVYDDDGSIATAFGVTLVPETWLVDPNGVIRWRTISPVTAGQLDAVVDELSGRSA